MLGLEVAKENFARLATKKRHALIGHHQLFTAECQCKIRPRHLGAPPQTSVLQRQCVHIGVWRSGVNDLSDHTGCLAEPSESDFASKGPLLGCGFEIESDNRIASIV